MFKTCYKEKGLEKSLKINIPKSFYEELERFLKDGHKKLLCGGVGMSNKLRIYEFAKLLDMQNKDLMDVLNKLNIEHKNHMSALEENDINLVLEYILQEKDKQQNR